FCALAGIVFVTAPLPLPEHLQALFAKLHLPVTSTFWLGPVCLAFLAAYLSVCAFGRSISVRGWRLDVPPLRVALMQVIVASGDLLLATAVMYVLLPQNVAISYW